MPYPETHPHPTDPTKAELCNQCNNPGTACFCMARQAHAAHGQVWDTTELQEDFTVEGFSAPFVVVTRKADGVRGSLQFVHYPRFYFGFKKA